MLLIFEGNLPKNWPGETPRVYVTALASDEWKSRTFCLNGAAARSGLAGDLVTIMVFGLYTPAEAAKHQPKVVLFANHNKIVKIKK